MREISYFNTDLFWALHLGDNIYIQNKVVKHIIRSDRSNKIGVVFTRWGRVKYDFGIIFSIPISQGNKLPISTLIDDIRNSDQVDGSLKSPIIKLKPFIFKKDMIEYANKQKPLKI